MVDVIKGIGSQSVEFLQKLDALSERRMPDCNEAVHTRQGGSCLDWATMAAAFLTFAV